MSEELESKIEELEDNNSVIETYERENLTYASLLTEDILITLVRYYEVVTVKYETLMDITNHCLNFIFNRMPEVLTLEMILNYVNISMPDELKKDNYKVLDTFINFAVNKENDFNERAKYFQHIRPLFAISVIEELQLCDLIERYETDRDNDFFYIRDLSTKTSGPGFKYGITSFNKDNKYEDEHHNIAISVTEVKTDLTAFSFELERIPQGTKVLRGEIENVGLLVDMILTKYLYKSSNYDLILNMVLDKLEEESGGEENDE